jgi:hypothetical protein
MTDPRVLEVMNERGRMAKAKPLAWEKPGRKERYAEALAS